MKKQIAVFDYAGEIMAALEKGVLLTTKVGERVNTMTISWGTLGIQWAKPIFTVFVRESRFTKGLLDQNPEFTINVPYGAFDPRILGFAGSKSGRTVDKLAELGLTTVPPEIISVPAIRELPLTLECRVIYQQKQEREAITEENLEKFYPQSDKGGDHDEQHTLHTAYYGEIVAAYIIE